MARHSSRPLRLVPPPRPQVIDSAVLGMLIFVFAEVMFFAGLISAFTIARAAAPEWPPPGQPRLPVQETLVNTLALLASGGFLYFAGRALRRERLHASRPLLVAMLLGAFFVVFQGVEWVALIREGLTLTSSTHGSFFYLIVGVHALHAVAGLALLIWVWGRLRRHRLPLSTFHAAQIFWFFVVGMWPLLYWRVYL